MKDYKSIMTFFISKNFHLWIKKVKGVAKKTKIGKYVDSDEVTEESKNSYFFRFSDYLVESEESDAPITSAVRRSVRTYDDLTESQQRSYKIEVTAYQMKKKINERIVHDIRLVDIAIKASVRFYISSEKMKSSIKNVLKILTFRYKRSDSEIIEQIHEKFQALQHSPSKAKIESWVFEGKNIKNLIVDMNVIEIFGSKVIFVQEFFKADRSGTSSFCDSGIMTKMAANKEIEFFEIIRIYRMTVEAYLKETKSTTFSNQAHLATLQKNLQKQGQNQGRSNPKSASPEEKKREEKEKFGNKTCVCGEVHLFRNCPYISIMARKPDGSKNEKIRNEIRQKVQQSPSFGMAISRVTDINILKSISEPPHTNRRGHRSGQKNNNQPKPSSVELISENSAFFFANSAFFLINMISKSKDAKSTNLFHKSIIYDSEAAGHLTFDKSRFVEDIKPIIKKKWINTPVDDMRVEGHGIMLIKGMLNEKLRDLHFHETAYMPDSDVSLVLFNILQKKGFFGNMSDDTLYAEATGQKICEMKRHYDLRTLEYSNMEPQMLTNAVQSKHQKKATLGIGHLRLGHYRPEVINHLEKVDEVEVLKNSETAPITVQCSTCAVSKMHQLIQRSSTAKTTKLFEMLHFDLTILDKGFDETSCVAHFTNEFISFNGVYPLINHKEASLLPIFKSLINHCDRTGIILNTVIFVIRSGQETFIEKSLKNGMKNQDIQFEGSAKYTPEQNGTFERHGALLTQKAKCIRHHSKLSKDLYSKYYLTAAYIMNRTPIKVLNGESSLVCMQRLTKKPIRWKLAHLKIFECKAYALLKGKDAFSKKNKMKSRAFVDYLVGYDSTNIFRVGNPEKYDVNDYKDVIFNESEYYDTYEVNDLLKKSKKADFVEFRIFDPRPAFDPVDSNDEKWLETLMRSRLFSRQPEGVMTPQSKEHEAFQPPTTSKNQPVTPKQLKTSDETSFMTSDLDFFSSHVTQRAKPKKGKTEEKKKKISLESLEQLPEISQTSFDVTEFRPRREVNGTNLNEAHIIEEKRTRRLNIRYVMMVYSAPKDPKIPDMCTVFNAAFMTEINRISSNPLNKLHQLHINNLPFSFDNGRAMLRHLHAEGFKNAANIEYSTLKLRDTGKIVDIEEKQASVPLKWVFTYKTNEDGYFIKYKARFVVRGDLQVASIQNVYAAILALKVFRILMAFVAAFDLKTKQLNTVNAFLNAKNDEPVYCYLPDGYKQKRKMMKMLKVLYDQKKSPLLGLRTLIKRCTKLGLYEVFEELCLFINKDGIFLFFYVDDIVIISRPDCEDEMESYVRKFQTMFEIRDLGELKFFFGICVLINEDHGTVSLVQNAYMERLAKEYQLDIIKKGPLVPIPGEIKIYEGEIDLVRINEYRKKIGSLCYSATVIRPDVAKAVFNLAQHFLNSGPDHMRAADQCIHYLYSTKHLRIQYSSASSENEVQVININQVQVFEVTADVSYANESDRRSGEGYTFKLFGGLIDWAVRRQTTVMTSIIEVELLSLLHAEKELLGWIHLFQKMKLDVKHDLILFNDNFQTIRLLNSEIAKAATKLRHIDIAQCWLRQEIQRDHINVEYLSISQMVIDGMIKLFFLQKHKAFVKQLGLVSLEKKNQEAKGSEGLNGLDG